jgi:hypothetical protein
LTEAQLAAAVGITSRSLAYYRSGRGCKAKTVASLKRWIEANIARTGPPTVGERMTEDDDDSSEIPDGSLREIEQRARIRKLNADAEAKELTNAQLRGELIEKTEIVREFAEFLAFARPILDAIPDDIATETPKDLRPRHRDIAKNAVDRALKKLSQWKPGQLSDATDSPESARAASVDKSDTLGA